MENRDTCSVLEIHGANADGIRSNHADEKGRGSETLAHQAVASTVMILSKSLYIYVSIELKG